MATAQKLIAIGLLLMGTLVTGLWLGHFAKPLDPFLTSAHKLLALAWAIFAIILVSHSARHIESRAAFFAAIAVLGVSIVALFASGALLTMPKVEGAFWLTVHRITSVAAAVTGAIAARFILLSKP